MRRCKTPEAPNLNQNPRTPPGTNSKAKAMTPTPFRPCSAKKKKALDTC